MPMMDLKGASEALTQRSVLDTDNSDLRIVKLLDKSLLQHDIVFGDGSVIPADTSAFATLVDFDFPGETHDDGLLLPAVQDDGLLLPAVQTDYGLLLPY